MKRYKNVLITASVVVARVGRADYVPAAPLS